MSIIDLCEMFIAYPSRLYLILKEMLHILCDYFFKSWFMWIIVIVEFTFLGQWWSGSDCTLHMDHPEDVKYIGQEHAIVMMNHKYDIDWMMGWILSERLSMLGVS